MIDADINAALRPIFGTEVHPQRRRQPDGHVDVPLLPAAIYEKISDTYIDAATLCGISDSHNIRLQVDVYARPYKACLQLAEEAAQALDPIGLRISKQCFPEDPDRASRVLLEYSIWEQQDIEIPEPVMPLSLSSIFPEGARAGDPALDLHLFGDFAVGDLVEAVGFGMAPTTYASASEIHATLHPAWFIGASVFEIVVHRASEVSDPQLFTVADRPAPFSVDPLTLEVGSGTVTVTLDGSAFLDGDVIVIDGEQQDTTFVSDTQLTCSYFAGAAAADVLAVQVVYAAPDGALIYSNRTGTPVILMTATPPPAVALDAIDPASITAGYRTQVVNLYGAFAFGDFARYDSSSALTTNWINEGQLQVIIPDGWLGVHTLEVLRGVTATPALDLTVRAAPLAVSLSPSSSAPGDGEVTVTVTGTDFEDGDTVLVQGVNCATVFVDSTHLEVILPASMQLVEDRLPFVAVRGFIEQSEVGAPQFVVDTPEPDLPPPLLLGQYVLDGNLPMPAASAELGLHWNVPSGAGRTISRMEMLLANNTASAGTIEGVIFGAFLGRPDYDIQVSANTHAAASLPANPTMIAFDFDPPVHLNGSQQYCIGIRMTGMAGTFVAYLDTAGTVHPDGTSAYDGGPFGSYVARPTRSVVFQLYGTNP